MHAYPILSIAIWLPILFGLLVLAIGSDRNPAPARWIALVGSVLSFIVTIPLITQFDSSTADLQFVEKANWIERFNIMRNAKLIHEQKGSPQFNRRSPSGRSLVDDPADE
jgi:NADH:ubiquinone oxidoreductase subunit 4 (subunit M)